MRNITLAITAAATLLIAGDGVAFLKIPVDPRACGLGEAAAGYPGSAASLYYNPAGLAGVESFDVLVMHNAWLLGMNHEYAAAGYGTRELGTFGLSFDYWGSGDISSVDYRGETLPGYTFSAVDWYASLGYARWFGPLSFGVGLKFISERVESLSTSAWALDAGGIWRLPVEGLTAGLSLTNVGTKAKLDQEEFSIPYSARLGWRWDVWDFGVTQDVILSPTERPGVAVGAEYRLAGILALRAGYRTGSDYQGLSGLRAGLGVCYRGLGVDYAFAPYGLLGNTHRLSLSFRGSTEESFE